jgi:hypothetical protein
MANIGLIRGFDVLAMVAQVEWEAAHKPPLPHLATPRDSVLVFSFPGIWHNMWTSGCATTVLEDRLVAN